MEDMTATKESSLDNRIAHLKDDAKAARQTAGGYAGLATAGVGIEVTNNLVLLNNKLAALVGFVITVGSVYFGVPQVLESVQMSNELVALEVVQAQQASQPEAQASEAG